MRQYNIVLTKAPGGVLIEFIDFPNRDLWAPTVLEALDLADEALGWLVEDLSETDDIIFTIYE